MTAPRARAMHCSSPMLRARTRGARVRACTKLWNPPYCPADGAAKGSRMRARWSRTSCEEEQLSIADFFTKQPRKPRKSSSVLGAHLTPAAKTPAAVGPPPSGVTEDDVAAMMLGLSGQPLTPGTSLDQQLQTGQLQAAWRNESGLWRSLSAEQWKMIERVVGGPLGFVDKSGRLVVLRRVDS